MARKFERAVWHAFGQLLWLVQRPYLRFLPYPYQSTSSPIVWAEQADSMVKSGAYARRHFRRAKINKAFTQVNMHECMQLRNRMGIEHCFVEDPVQTVEVCNVPRQEVREVSSSALERLGFRMINLDNSR